MKFHKSWMIVGVIAVLGIAGYTWVARNVVVGSGVKASEERELAAIEEIVLQCSSDVKVTVGGAQKVVLSGDDNILELIQTEVTDGKLVISSDKRYQSKTGMLLELTVGRLKSARLSGSGDIYVGALTEDNFVAKITGSGDVKVGPLQGQSLSAKISGSGDITVFGKVNTVEAGISGSGWIGLGGLSCQTAETKISGSGSILVRASESLSARISGSGEIGYHGKPKVDSKVTGSGRVVAKN